jgi:tRNA-Thr(GGU) m(6)t(6)A37 methyltransferase TsaA
MTSTPDIPAAPDTPAPADVRTVAPVAYARTPYPTKFGVPRQPGLADALVSTVELAAPYDEPDALRGLDGFDYLWLLWGFHHNARPGWTPTVRPPRLGGTSRMGVFATRSSFRPNDLALSCVRLVAVEPSGLRADGTRGPLVRVAGADMVDGSPVYDIKPYLPFCDSHPGARVGWVDGAAWEPLAVHLPPELAEKVPEHLRAGLVQLLEQDPRPAYTRGSQDGREYWVPLDRLVVRFTVEGRDLQVTSVERLDDAAYQRLRATGTV